MNNPKVKKVEVSGKEGIFKDSKFDFDDSLFSYDELFSHTKLGAYRNTPGPKGHFLRANLSLVRMFEADSKEEFLRHNASDFYQNPSDRADFSKKMLKKGFLESEELALRTLKGKKIICAVTAVMKKDPEGNIYFDGIIEDITERKATENALRETIARFNAAQRIAHIGSWELDIAKNILTWSDEIYSIFEIDPKKFGASYDAFLAAIHPDDRKAVDFAYTNSLRTKTPYSIGHRLLFPDGRIKYVHEQCESFYDNAGKPIRSLGTVQDITERKIAEKKLISSEARYKKLIETEPECVKILSKDNILLDMNPAGLAMIEADSLEQVAGKSVLGVIDPEYRGIFMNVTRQVFDGKESSAQFKITGLKGGKRWLETHGVPLRDENGEIYSLLAITRDITGQKRNEELLKGRIAELEKLKATLVNLLEELEMKEQEVESEKSKYEALLGSISDGVVAINFDEKIIYANDEAANLLGVSREQLIGKNYFEMWDASAYYSDAVLPHSERPITLALRSGKKIMNLKLNYIRKDGKKFPVAMSTSQIFINGEIIGANIIFRDITMEEKINRAKTEFISIASHQLKTPLSSMKWMIETLSGSKNLAAGEQAKLKNIFISNERLIALVNDLLSISKMEEGKFLGAFQSFNIIDLLKSAVKIYESEASKTGKKIVLQLPEAAQEIYGNPILLSEAFSNILSNAIIYGKNDSTITVKMAPINGAYLISVNNLDHFISAEDKDKIFTKFFRAASARLIKPEGSGLGLYISKMAIEKNGGTIWFDSNEKDGTTFYFTIPIHAK